MRAITLKPWWAWAVAEGWKDREYRSRRFNLAPGELLAIHAGSSSYYDSDLDEVERKTGHRPPDDLYLGAVVAVAEVVKVAPNPDVPGAWVIHLKAVRRLEEPVAVKGQLGVWNLPTQVEEEVSAATAHAQRRAVQAGR